VHTAVPRLDVTAPEMARSPTPCHGAYPRNYPIKSPRSSNSLLSPSRASSTAPAEPDDVSVTTRAGNIISERKTRARKHSASLIYAPVTQNRANPARTDNENDCFVNLLFYIVTCRIFYIVIIIFCITIYYRCTN